MQKNISRYLLWFSRNRHEKAMRKNHITLKGQGWGKKKGQRRSHFVAYFIRILFSMDPILCTINQIASGQFSQNSKTVKLGAGIKVQNCLLFGKIISVIENKQLILDHNGFKCKIIVSFLEYLYFSKFTDDIFIKILWFWA
jgi:hypothetical protein